MSIDIKDIAGPSGKWVKLAEAGDEIVGDITDVFMQDATFEGEVRTTRKGKVIRELVFTLATALRDADNAEDDGERVFATGGKWRLHEAIAAALKDADATALEVGGRIKITVTGTDKDDKRALTWSAKYKKPAAPAVSADDL
jgi:hypothetical protein